MSHVKRDFEFHNNLVVVLRAVNVCNKDFVTFENRAMFFVRKAHIVLRPRS